MKNVCMPFEGRKITILGLGVLGRGVGDAEFLAKCGAHVVVTDKKSEAELAESVARLQAYPNVAFHLGGHQEKDFTNADLVIKAAGVRLDSPEIAAARAAGVEVAMSTALFAKYAIDAGAKIIGVTGTRGKSTVTQMIFDVLSGVGKKVLLGGNVRGVSTLAMLPEVSADTIVVLELDSWQLQGFGDLKISPQIAIFTNLMPDHQNYYSNMDEYFADKANIFRFQKEEDVVFVGKDILERVSGGNVPPEIPTDWKLKIPGAHNRENAAFAVAALHALGLSEHEIKDGIEAFEGVEGRLQLVREVNGVKIYNDNNATTPEATIAALKALDTGNSPSPKASSERRKNIILIMGGSDKGLDMSTLLYEIAQTCKRVICLPGSGTERITPFMADYSIYSDLDEACREAVRVAQPGDVVLFSPAFASFGMFKNEYERNDKFMEIVRSIV